MPVKDFPRILLVTSSVFNPYSGGGVTLTNLFRGWPGDRIAAIHSDSTLPDTQVCQRFYRLTNLDVRTMWPLVELGVLRRAVRAVISNNKDAGPMPSGDATATVFESTGRFRQWFYDRVVGDGLPMRVKLSHPLEAFIREFRPELVYTFLGDLPYMQLVQTILRHYPVPLVIHLMDDWPSVRYRRGWFASLQSLQSNSLLRSLLRRAALRMGISDAMCRAYEERYGLSFVAFHNAIPMSDWDKIQQHNLRKACAFRLVYSGSIMPSAQLDSLRDICEAVWKLHSAGVAVTLSIHAPPYATHYRNELERPPAVTFGSPPADDDAIRSE